MNTKKKIGIIYYLCAVANYISAAIILLGRASNIMGYVFLCIGAMWLSLGALYSIKAKKDENSAEDDKRE